MKRKTQTLLSLCLGAGFTLSTQAQNVFIDFGQSALATPGNWNNITDVSVSTTPITLIDFDTGDDSVINFEVTDNFQTTTAQGRQAAIGDFPATAVRDTFFTNAGLANPTGAFTFSGLDPNQKYEFIFMATRDADNDRSTLYTLAGAETDTTEVDPHNTGSGIGNISSVYSDASGSFTLTVEKAAANETDFAYISGLQIRAIPEPSTSAALIGFAAWGLALIRRRRD